MTESERIIKEGILPESFFREETICDTFVSSTLKKVWAISIDLYLELRRVCEKHHLRLFSDGGTTLGAVRHKGFIPWDDDMDFCLLREDYDKLLTLKDEFSFPYFLLTPQTNEEFGYSFIRLCNSNSTLIHRPFVNAKYNHGVCIDIFPIDKIQLQDYLEIRNKIKELIYINSAYMRRNVPEPTPRDLEMISKLPSQVSLQDNWKEINRLAKTHKDEECEYVSLLASVQYSPENKIWPKKIFDASVELPFYNYTMLVPIGYKRQLEIYFGDYMKFPPVEVRNTWHSIEYAPDVPFEKYYKEHFWK